MTSKNLGKRLRNHSKGWVQYQAPLKMSASGYKGGRGEEDMTQGPRGMTRNFCMAKHIVPSLVHGKALLCFSWEASTTTHLGAGIWWDTPQKRAEQTEAKGPFTPGSRALLFVYESQSLQGQKWWPNVEEPLKTFYLGAFCFPSPFKTKRTSLCCFNSARLFRCWVLVLQWMKWGLQKNLPSSPSKA